MRLVAEAATSVVTRSSCESIVSRVQDSDAWACNDTLRVEKERVEEGLVLTNLLPWVPSMKAKGGRPREQEVVRHVRLNAVSTHKINGIRDDRTASLAHVESGRVALYRIVHRRVSGKRS